ncbi:hypothetical protein ACFYE9_04385 [Rhizobium leguminosarum]|uniref:Uncharacterized protein n=2 Tax=Rhizobium leguminosarum TaxID=384 RepID=A0A154ILS2_RHILE|nr:hypothetical protein [Rhizobium leguminosarum]KZB01539.1 hypothetical protein A4A59_01280 [Rhizobium leguminosarum]
MSTAVLIFFDTGCCRQLHGFANFHYACHINFIDRGSHILYLESFKTLRLLPQLMLKAKGKG